ncbi:hypothetical protein THAOC_36396, partial [Thalassiosira oceanica]
DEASDDDESSDDDGSSDDDESSEETDDCSSCSDRRPKHTASMRAPSNGNATVVLKNGWTGQWMDCTINPESVQFSWNDAKQYFFNQGGKMTWYKAIFLKESARQKAERCAASAASNYQSPHPVPPQPPYPPLYAPTAYHYRLPPAPSHAPPQRHAQVHHFQSAPYTGPPSYGAPVPFAPPSFGCPPHRHF